MDGVVEHKQVFVIAATNRLEKIDSAMLKAGRLGKVIYVGLPSPDDRVEILRSLTKVRKIFSYGTREFVQKWDFWVFK